MITVEIHPHGGLGSPSPFLMITIVVDGLDFITYGWLQASDRFDKIDPYRTRGGGY